MEMEEQLQRVIGTYDSAEPNMDAIIAAVDNEDENISAETQAAKEYMSKLKFNYIEMKTKKYFLEQLREFKVDDVPACPVDEATMDAQKEKVQAIKAQNAELEKDMGFLAHDIIEEKQECDRLRGDLENCIQDITKERELIQQIEQDTNYQNDQLTKQEQSITQDDVDVMAMKVEELKRRISQLNEQKQAQMEQLKASKDALSDASNKRTEFEDALKGSRTSQLVKLQRQKRQFKESIQSFSNITGTDIEAMADSFVEVNMRVQEGEDLVTRHVHIDFDAETKEISRIVIDGSSAFSKSLMEELKKMSNTTNIQIALSVIRQTLIIKQ
eukprot:m.144469 g.144469  ORF g.144469 m.144469 type:complete len:328 (+) comp13223_c0_seq8:130-1113(+)